MAAPDVKTPAKPVETVKDLAGIIEQSGRVTTNAQYVAHTEALFGQRKLTPGGPKPASPGSTIIQVGNSPDGFGKGIIWSRAEEAIMVALFLNAADPLGVSISGVEATDYIAISSVDGMASFSQDTGNPWVSSIIGIIGAGLEAVLDITGFGSALSPLVGDATQFAESQFAPTGVRTDIRDAFGSDTNGKMARAEGGLLISLPQADGPYYSGQNTDRWIKSGATVRDDAHRPDDVKYGFFPVRNVPVKGNSRQAGSNGDVYITPWDWKFEDNAGYYKALVIVSKNSIP